MDQLGIGQAIIGGHSMGGFITQEIYRQAPERVLGIVLVGATAVPASIVEQNLWRGFAMQTRAEGVPSLVPELLDELLAGSTRLEHPELLATMTGIIEQTSVRGAAGGARALRTRLDYSVFLSRINVPALIFVGAEDTVYPIPLAEALDGGIPKSQLVLIENASHVPMIEMPEAFNAAFLQWAGQNVPSSQSGAFAR